MLETQNGCYPITFPMVYQGSPRAFTVILKPQPNRLDFAATEVRFASGEKVVGDIRNQLITEAKRHFFVTLESMGRDEPIGRFDRNERVLVAYYYTLACYLRDDRRVVADSASLPILYAAASAIASKTSDLHQAARQGGHKVPQDFEDRIRRELQSIRTEWKNRNQQLFFDNDRWEFFVSCLATTFAWRNRKIGSRALRLALPLMPEYHRRTIREAGGR